MHFCEDAAGTVERMAELEKSVAGALNKVHEVTQREVNRGRSPRDPPEVGDRVWVLRPKGVGGNEISSWWLGPYRVTERVGQASFRVQVRPGIIQDTWTRSNLTGLIKSLVLADH